MLSGKHILLGVTGSIAAYKAANLVRLLVKAGCEVQVIMTPLAKEFITPLTMATLSQRPILVEFFNPENGAWNSHIKLGEWADCMLVAPATANTIAKMAHGIADNLLLTSYLSARCRVAIAPAMDLDMYAHEVTQQNIETLRKRGVEVIEPGSGFLASGLEGKGRMAEPEQIVESLEKLFDVKKKSLLNRHFLVTAGATREAIDPVRYITNHSTGKMGYAIAEELASRGAKVSLVSGPTLLPIPKGVERIDVESAEQMFTACKERFQDVDGAVMCAAVADYTPKQFSDKKIKKSDNDLYIELKRTHDIAAELGREKGKRVLVGFALETDNEQVHASEKLKKKSLDFIVLNSLRDKGAGFGVETNIVTLIDEKGSQPLPIMAKSEVAIHIVNKIESLLK